MLCNRFTAGCSTIANRPAASRAEQRRPTQQQGLRGAASQHDGHQQGGRGNHGQLGNRREHGEVAKRLGHRQGEAHEKSDQQDQHAARHRLGHAGRGLAVAQQVLDPQADVPPFALAKQHAFGVELVRGPANRQAAANQASRNPRSEYKAAPAGSCPSSMAAATSTTPVIGIRLLPKFSSTPGAIGRIDSGIVTSISGIR